MSLRYLSVCSGIEAASVAWEPLGWTPSAFAEIDPFASAVLAHRFPHVPNLGDFTRITAADVGPIDLLVGGTPCQGFSVAGKRLGLDDPRSNLALDFCRLARRLRPRWVVWENVPGVHSNWSGAPEDEDLAPGECWEGDEDSDFGAFLDTLEECGYSACWRVLDAQFVRVESHPWAVPQRRERVFLVGYLGDWRPPAAVLLEPEGLRGHPPPRRQAGQAVAGSLGAGSERSGGRVGRREAAANHLVPEYAKPLSAARGRAAANADDQETYIPEITGTLNHNGKAAGSATQQDAEMGMLVAFSSKDYGADFQEDVAPTLRAMGHDASHANAGGQLAIAFGGNNTAGPVDVATACRAKGGTGHGDFESETFVAHAIAIPFDTTQITSKGNRCQPVDGGPCHPLAAHAHAHAPALAHHAHGWAVRRLTPLEWERLQGFPDSWTDVPYRGRKAADGPRYKALGNSMAVNCMTWIGVRIDLFEQLRTAA